MHISLSMGGGIVVMLDSFRRKLRQEAQIWQEEGLINNSQYEQLAERYQFDNLETVAQDRFVVILISLGSILFSLGVITFVAANWQAWSKEVKLALLLSLFLTSNIIGFYLWRQPPQAINQGRKLRRRKQILGHGLLLLGALLLGANMALLAQVFHIGGSGYELFLAWGIGVLVMAYSLRLISLGIFAILLVQIGYWIGLGQLSYNSRDLTWTELVVQHMPLLAWVLFVPLAYQCQSRWIFALGVIAFATSLQFNLAPLAFTYSQTAPWAASFAYALPPALLWSYDDLLLPKVNFRWFQPLARSLALVFFSILFYTLSFRGLWDTTYSTYQQGQNLLQQRSYLLIDLAVLSAFALLQWFYLLRYRPNAHRQRMDVTNIIIGSFILITALVPFWHQGEKGIYVTGIVIFNILLALLACGLIQVGLKLSQRRAFWGGMVLLTLQIISRMLEYDTDLLFKSLVFVLCGVGVILAGLWFENHLHRLSHSPDNN
jgi:uncharacterized membrane protein